VRDLGWASTTSGRSHAVQRPTDGRPPPHGLHRLFAAGQAAAVDEIIHVARSRLTAHVQTGTSRNCHKRRSA
jgi:hypothetical protein